MVHESSHSVSEYEVGSRLDAFVSRALKCGIRGAKRLILEGSVLVNSRTRPPQYKLMPGAIVVIRRDEAGAFPLPPIIVTASKDYCAFLKPAGLHSVSIIGSGEASLEQTLALQWNTPQGLRRIPANSIPIPTDLINALGGPNTGEDHSPDLLPPIPTMPPVLLSRLDAATSGLVAAAFTSEGEKRFRELEATGKVDKYYLALVHGSVSEPFRVTNALDTKNRKKTRVFAEDSTDQTRHSEVVPLPNQYIIPGIDISDKTTLVSVHIKRGVRHQIRAHLAHAGFPLVGDTLYGAAEYNVPLHLHHARLMLPGFSVFYPPAW